MATSGALFYTQLQEKVGVDYSAYFDPARANDIIKEAFIKAVEIKYADITSEKNTDELFNLIKTSVTIPLTNNQIALLSIPDYLHVLALKTFFTVPLRAKVTGASNAKPIVLTLDSLTNLRDSNFINLSGIIGVPAANGNFYVEKLYDDFANNEFTYQLYYDEKLTRPVIGNGTYVKGGLISVVIDEWAKKKES